MADPGAPRGAVTRRSALLGGLAVVGGAVGGALVADARSGGPVASSPAGSAVDPGAAMEPFHGAHQSGVATTPQSHVSFCAFDLLPGITADRVSRLMRLLTDDIARMASGRPALGDTAPELALRPARLTVTVGFGYEMFDAIDRAAQRPAALTQLPVFALIDQLEDRYGGGDLMLQICADDALTVAHAQRMLSKDTRAFASPRWTQRGFLPAPVTGTARNLMGQLDGTVNPASDQDREQTVWSQDPGWFAGGTTMVLRRLRMDLDRWDELDRSAMEAVIGRRLSDGSPLTGAAEHDEPDFLARDATGLPAIADFAHIRVARGGGPAATILRRPYAFDDSPGPDGRSDLGQLFCAFQSDIATHFVPIQQRLAQGDLLNQWVTPVGSAVFAILPGCQPGGYLGDRLLG